MKKLILYSLASLSFMATFAQDCNIGNQIATSDFVLYPNGDIFSPNYLLGVKYTLNEEGTLYSINLLGEDTGSGVQMALYGDNMGIPDNLIVATAQNIVGSGIVSLPVTPVVLPPGDYWVMAVYENYGSHTLYNPTALGNVVYYKSLDFGTPLPTNASDFISYTDQDFLYFLEIGCGDLIMNVGNIENKNQLKIYPNPATDSFSIKGLTETTSYSIVNTLGIQVTEGAITPNGNIVTKDLASGFYGLQLANGQTLKFIRE